MKDIRDYFKDITFEESKHKYTFEGLSQAPISVTGFIGQFQEPFAGDRIAGHVIGSRIKKGLINEEAFEEEKKNLLNEWEENKEAAGWYGTLCHKYIEDYFNGQEFSVPQVKEPTFMNSAKIGYEKFEATKETINELIKDIEKRFEHIGSEIIVGDKEWNITGTVDAIFKSKKTGKYHILDWKTNKKYEKSSRYKMIKDLSYLDACSHNVYSLQLSFYKAIIERNTPYEIESCFTVHFNDNKKPTMNKAVDYSLLVTELVNGRM